MAKISRRKLARGVVAQLRARPVTAKQLIRQTAAYLVTTRRAHEVDLFVRDVAEELARVDGRLSAEVESAFKLDASAKHAIDHLLQKATGATKIELHELINPDLLGGVIIRTPRYELDTSIKTQLAQLRGGSI